MESASQGRTSNADNQEWGRPSYAVYELPVGRNKKWGKNLNPVIDAVVSNWQVGGIVQVRGGFPLTIFADEASGTNSRGSRANCLAPPHVFGKKPAFDGPGGPFIGLQWFDPASYSPADPGTFGTCGIGTARGPGLRSADLSLQKQFSFGESKKLEFRTEFFNVTNTPMLNIPYTYVNFKLGIIDRSQGERNIQFALKLYF